MSKPRSAGASKLRLQLPEDNRRLANLTGPLDENLRQIEDELGVKIRRRGGEFQVQAGAVAGGRALELIGEMHERSRRPLGREDVQMLVFEQRQRARELQEVSAAIAAVQAEASATADAGETGDSSADPSADPAASTTRAPGRRPGRGRGPHPASLLADPSLATSMQSSAHPGSHAVSHPGDGPALRTRRSDLRGRTPTQRRYLEAILGHDISFGIGPAGTGKTYLAVACAVDALERDQVQRIVLTRPAVEAGERLGFLPGDLAQKVDPYLRPLYDALFDLLGFDKTQKLLERQTIEIAPLAYMRGRTLNQSFVILDEAQNTTPEQMKMFLTRIGFGSRAVITGDVTQIDLPRGATCGLVEARRVLDGVRGIAFTQFTAEDVVRHPLVARIVEAYERAGQTAPMPPPPPPLVPARRRTQRAVPGTKAP